jgi:uncharacterized membrane protein YccC
VRLWASVCLALFVAFWLQLDNPSWAGTSAAIVCQPVLGASLRKGWFRLIGTLIGGIVIVLLTAAFPQSRAGFLIGLALWCAICGFFASLLRNFASYAAALAGYTAAIVAGDELGATGGVNGLAFHLAVMRVSEISLGIVCAGFVMALTDSGRARRRLAALLAGLGNEALVGLLQALRLPAAAQAQSRTQRRAMVQQVGGLDAIIDQVLGEESALRFRPRPLQAAVDGLLYALSAWRGVSLHLELAPDEGAEHEAALVLQQVPPALTEARSPHLWLEQAGVLHAACLGAARRLVGMNAETPSLRLLADRTAAALLGLRDTLAALMLLENPHVADVRRQIAPLRVPDILPPVVSAIRGFVTVGATALVWIVTAWPSGATAMVFAAVTVTLFSPRADQAYGFARSFMLGTAITAVLAWVIGFLVLPRVEGFLAFSLALGLVLIPAGALSGGTWAPLVFVAITANFVPLLAPSNPMSYDVVQFYNTAIAIVGGVGIAMLGLRLIPAVPPGVRAERLLLLTLRDLRRIAAGRLRISIEDWEARVYGRLTAMPEQIDVLQSARLVAAAAAGSATIRLRRLVLQPNAAGALHDAMNALVHGDTAVAIADLQRFDAVLSETVSGNPTTRLRARGVVRVLSESLAQHPSYFGAALA